MYGDAGADTLGNLSRHAGVGPLALPNLGALGLGHLTAIAGVPPTTASAGAHGAMIEASAGKDTITGHWEMAGLITKEALPTFPHGFPPDILVALRAAAGGRGLLGNRTASGTAIIEELGERHMASGDLIVYTSADSVLQIAAAVRHLRAGARHRRSTPHRPGHRAAVRGRARAFSAHLQPP